MGHKDRISATLKNAIGRIESTYRPELRSYRHTLIPQDLARASGFAQIPACESRNR